MSKTTAKGSNTAKTEAETKTDKGLKISLEPEKDETNPFDLSLSDGAKGAPEDDENTTEPEDEDDDDDELDDLGLGAPEKLIETPVKASDDKPEAKRTRRTKAEIEAEAVQDAITLLRANGFVVSDVNTPEQADGTFVPEKLPVNAASNDIVGSLKTNPAGVVILTISPKRWVGEAPLVLPASQLDDVLAVISQLRADSLSK